MTDLQQPQRTLPDANHDWPSSHAVGLRPVLIADDDASSVSLVEMRLELLRLANPRVTVADGSQAVDYLTRCVAQGNPLPALVLLDGHMPGRSGPQVLAWMKDHLDLRDIPVVLLTGDSSREAIRDAYAAGATSYLVKPVGFDALAEVLRGLEAPWALT